MKNRVLALVVMIAMIFAVQSTPAYAVGFKEGGSSLLLPTTGQAQNGQLGNTKTKIMAGVEVAAITTLAILAGVAGGGVTWFAIGPLLANHLWSSADAYKNAQHKVEPQVQQQMFDAQRTLELSRQRRFEREQIARSEVRDRVQMAGELAATGY